MYLGSSGVSTLYKNLKEGASTYLGRAPCARVPEYPLLNPQTLLLN